MYSFTVSKMLKWEKKKIHDITIIYTVILKTEKKKSEIQLRNVKGLARYKIWGAGWAM